MAQRAELLAAEGEERAVPVERERELLVIGRGVRGAEPGLQAVEVEGVPAGREGVGLGKAVNANEAYEAGFGLGELRVFMRALADESLRTCCTHFWAVR